MMMTIDVSLLFHACENSLMHNRSDRGYNFHHPSRK